MLMDRLNILQKIGIYIAVFIFLLFVLLSFIEMFRTSLRPLDHLMTADFELWGDDSSFQAFRDMWVTVPLPGRYILNSIFIADHPGVTVNMEAVEWGTCQDKSMQLAAAGDPPSIACMGSRTLRQLAANDLIVPVTFTAEEEAMFQPGVLSTVRHDGQYWGIPHAFSTKALYINCAVVESAGAECAVPATWEELVALAAAVTEGADTAGIGMAGKDFDNTMHMFLDFLYSNDGLVFDPQTGEPALDSQQTRETLQLHADLLPYMQSGPTEWERDQMRDLFNDNQIAMYVSGPRGRGQHDEETRQIVAPIPHGPSGDSGTILITDSIAVFKGTGHEDLALDLAKALTSGAAQYDLDSSWGLTPILDYEAIGAEALGVDKIFYADDPFWQIFVAGISTGGPEPRVEDFKALQAVFTNMVQGIILGEGSVDELVTIAGLEEATTGRIVIGGRDVSRAPPVDRGIAMVFQSYALYPHLSVYENIAFPLRVQKLAEPEVKRKVEQAAGILQLTDKLGLKPGQLSGGQRQRVAIGRSIVRNPQVFLFDEPLSNLDAALRGDMRVELSQLHRDLGATMVHVTHDQVEAMTMADRIVVLNAGRIEQSGTPVELYHHPATRFVATFIGQPNMNLVPATVKGRDSAGLAVELPGGATMVLPVESGAASPGDRVEVGIRPENIELGQGLSMRIRVLERLGGVSITYGEIDGARFCASLPGDAPLREGDTVSLTVDPRHAHVFDAQGRVLRRLGAPALVA